MPTLLADWRWSLLAAAAVRLACSRETITSQSSLNPVGWFLSETKQVPVGEQGRCEWRYPVTTNADFVPTGGSHEGASNDFSFTCFGSRVGC